jgi:hypothetical protein
LLDISGSVFQHPSLSNRRGELHPSMFCLLTVNTTLVIFTQLCIPITMTN